MTGKEKRTASEEEIDYCQFHVWYPLLRQLSIKGEAVQLDEEFLQYLREDGIMLPGSSRTVDADSDSEESIDGKVLAVHSEIPEFDRLKHLQDHIQLIMNRFDGEIFVKMNWSAPIDALWVNGETAKCLNVDDVFLLLKSSDRVWFDIEKMYDMCDNTSKKSPEQLYLIVKKWANLNPAMEFRLFVLENQLRGISQRDCCTHYKFLHEQWEDLEDKIVEFYDEHITGKLSIQSYTMDIYVDRKGRIWIVDINPFGEPTCPLLFDWLEFSSLPELEFRFVKSDEEKLQSTKGTSRGPIDVHMSTDFSKFMDICKQQMEEPDSEEEG